MTYPQRELFFPAGSQPVETSESAADRLSGELLNERRLKVLRLFARTADGLTPDEVVKHFGGSANSWAPRVTELLQVGMLDRLDGKGGRRKERRTTRAGGTGFVHAINAHGRAHLGDQ